MPKNVIFCADGTWNGPGQNDADDKVSDPSNVFKTFLNLDGVDSVENYRLANEQERALRDGSGRLIQIAKYLHGVGDSDNFLVKLLGGTLGAGLISRIVRGYTFISRNYVPGDKICIVGFSRGAYTARALAGLIVAKGLLDARKIDLTDKEQAYRLGAAVWYSWRRGVLSANKDWLGKLEELAIDLPGFLTRPPTADLRPNIEIEAVAVWDTVGALGIPVFNQENYELDVFKFADTQLSPNVRHGLHAVAVDEVRASFTPTLWDTRTGLSQVLFAGAHADVGGGYPQADNESGLSDITLKWMTGQLIALGIIYSSRPTVRSAPSPQGVGHQPWKHSPWDILPRAARKFPTGMILSRSVLERINGLPVVADPGLPPAPYAPDNLDFYEDEGIARAGIATVDCD